MIRVQLPFHLRTLATVTGEVAVDVAGPVTPAAIIDALEVKYPTLRGTMREHGSLKRRPLVRFFACQEDISNAPLDTVLPDAVARGDEPFLVIGAIAGG